MNEDNAYPTDGTFIDRKPKSVEREQSQERKDALTDVPVKKAIEALQKAIELYSSVDGIPDEVMVEPEKFMHVVLANKIAVQNLILEKNKLQSIADAYIQ